MAKHILVLSNNPNIVRRLHDTLEPDGYRVTVVPVEADVAEEVARHKAELVILAPGREDAEPGSEEEVVQSCVNRTMKCLGETGEIRKTKKTEQTGDATRPGVLVLTPRGFHGGLTAYRTGADMYLMEKFHPLELLAFVRRLIGRSEE